MLSLKFQTFEEEFILFYFQFALVGYCIHNGDIDRILYGYDLCGDICGKKNKETTIEGCVTGKDNRNMKLVYI